MILLTGGTGLLGLHILDELRSRNRSVRALARTDAAAEMLHRHGAGTLIGTVEAPDTWARVEDCEAIIHSAAVISTRGGWDRYRQVNIEGTRLAAARARELGVPLLHVSSVAVYGRQKGRPLPITEDAAFGELPESNFYARSKRLAEEAVWEEAARGLDATAFRPCVIYGEGDRLFLPGVARALRYGWAPVIGRGDRPLTLVHARNVAAGIVAALDRPAARGRPYNLTNDGDVTPRLFLEALGRGIGRKIRVVPVPEAIAFGLARVVDSLAGRMLRRRYPGSLRSAVGFWRGGNPYTSARAVEQLDWRPVVDHRDGLERAGRLLGE